MISCEFEDIFHIVAQAFASFRETDERKGSWQISARIGGQMAEYTPARFLARSVDLLILEINFFIGFLAFAPVDDDLEGIFRAFPRNERASMKNSPMTDP